MSGTSPLPDRSYQSAAGSYNAQASWGSTAIVSVFQNAVPRPADPAEVAAAWEVLGALPLDELPEHHGLPSGSVMPWRRNRFFVGREPDLRVLARQLKENGTAAVGQSPVVTGLGGQGKTQLAVEFAYRYGHWFKGGVFWISCADPVSIPQAVAACGPQLYPTEAGFSARPLPERVALVASAWASDLPRLLIFDSCEDEATLDAWSPTGGGCRLLITARRASWSEQSGIMAVPLGRLARPESLALLHHHRPDLALGDPGLDAISEELGDLPLALELAGSYLARYRHEASGVPATYLAELRAVDVLAHGSLRVEDPQAPGCFRSLTGHELHVARTFEMSLRQLRPENGTDALAHDLFAYTAWLAPDVPIPRHLLKLCAGMKSNDGEADRKFADALGRLRDLALVEDAGENGAVVLHRLLAVFAKQRVEQTKTIRQGIEAAIADESERLLSGNDPTPFRNWAVHLVTVALAAGRDGTETSVRLLNDAGYYNMLIANFEVSNTLLQDATSRAEALFGPDHLLVANILGNLGIVQRERGDLAAAEGSQIRALAIEEVAYGPDHPEVARTLGNLGILQRERGDLVAAEASQTRALAIFENKYGPDHPDVARTLGNLSGLQRERGNLDAAEASLVQALAVLEKAFGPDHPQVAIALVSFSTLQINLGILQHEQNRFLKAQESCSQAVVIFTNKLGEQHPHTIKARRLMNVLSGNARSLRGGANG